MLALFLYSKYFNILTLKSQNPYFLLKSSKWCAIFLVVFPWKNLLPHSMLLFFMYLLLYFSNILILKSKNHYSFLESFKCLTIFLAVLSLKDSKASMYVPVFFLFLDVFLYSDLSNILIHYGNPIILWKYTESLRRCEYWTFFSYVST